MGEIMLGRTQSRSYSSCFLESRNYSKLTLQQHLYEVYRCNSINVVEKRKKGQLSSKQSITEKCHKGQTFKQWRNCWRQRVRVAHFESHKYRNVKFLLFAVFQARIIPHDFFGYRRCQITSESIICDSPCYHDKVIQGGITQGEDIRLQSHLHPTKTNIKTTILRSFQHLKAQTLQIGCTATPPVSLANYCSFLIINILVWCFSLAFWNIIYHQTVMGNALDNRSHALARHWTPAGPNCYKHSLTGELVSSYSLQLSSSRDITHMQSLLTQRAALSHPQVPKLIYFTHRSTSNICNRTQHTVQLFIEHLPATLASFLPQKPLGCMCCAIANGLSYLYSRYGPFRVSAESLWLVEQKQRKREVVKCWINSDIRSSQPDVVSEEQMSRLIVLLLKQFRCQLGMGLEVFKSPQQVFQFIYKTHHQNPVEHSERKRGQSYTKLLSSNQSLTRLSQPQELKHNTSFEQKRKSVPDSPIAQWQSKQGNTPSRQTTQADIFHRPEGTAFQKKVQFNYPDLTTTPKNNKTCNPSKKSTPIHFPTAYQPTKLSKTFTSYRPLSVQTGTEPTRTVPLISRFSQDTDLLVSEEQPEDRLKDIIGTTRVRPQSSNVSFHPQPVSTADNTLTSRGIKRQFEHHGQYKRVEMPHDAMSSSKRSVNLKLQNNICMTIDSSDKMFKQEERVPQKKKSVQFMIANEYKISVEPEKQSLCDVPVDSSEQLSVEKAGKLEQLAIPSGLNFQQNASSEDSWQHKTKLQEHQPPSNANNYNKYIKQLQEVRLADSKLEKPKALYSQRIHPSKFAINQSQSSEYLANSGKYITRQQQYPQVQKVEVKARGKIQDRKGSRDLSSLYNSCSSEAEEQKRKVRLMQKIKNTEEVLRQNRRKLQRLHSEKELQREKGLLRKQVDGLGMGSEQTLRIKQKVKHKRATFAELKAEASKILEDFNF